MSKRKQDTVTEGSCSPSELKKMLVETDSEISRVEILNGDINVNVEDMECEEIDENIGGEDEKELEMRDKLLEESSPGFNRNKFVNHFEKSDNDITKKPHMNKIIILKGKLPNLSLPSGWIALRHRSGGIIYLHRESRVCTWARPYHLGDGSVRKHDVPTAAIPCLHQFVALKKFEPEENSQNGYTVPGEGSDGVRNLNDHVFDGNTTEAENSGDSGNTEEYADECDGIMENDIEPGDGDLDNQITCPDSHDASLANHDGNLVNHDGNFVNHDGNHDVDLANHDGNFANHDGNHDVDLANHDGNFVNHDGNHDVDLANHDGNFVNHDGNHDVDLANHDGNLVNHDGKPGNHDGNLDNCDGNLDNHSRNLKKCSHEDLNNVAESNSEGRSQSVATRPESCIHGENQDGKSNQLFEISSGEIEMTTTTKLSAYLGKLWEFQEMTSDEKQPLFSFCLNPDEDDVQEDSSEVVKTIPFLIQGVSPLGKVKDKCVINPAGKSPQSLLHEYCTKALKLKPMYKTVESGNLNNPFLAIVEINGLQYGSGMASSKKQARHIAAQATLEILMPGTFEKKIHIEQHLKVFDNVSIEDPTIYELTSKLGLMSPNQVLDECVKRNQGVLSSKVNFEMHHTPDRKIYYAIECGKHKATGPCRNKKIGRELAAQALLKQLHPHLNNWGSLIRIYMDKHTAKEFMKADDKSLNMPSSSINRELLSDLKHEMWQLLKDKKSNPCTRFTSTKLTDIVI